ncbi:MAG TPA: ATP-binding cassette domain-containing protein [Ilumatobacteraceae bacterium]|nr:ATP-binding cassette domain-containing protein [Ilumatobacteraceae bacterium]
MIDVVELSVHFGGVVSLDEMTVQFPEGTCGLIAPNGAGKTTFFNVLSGFVRPRSGRVEAMGQDLLAMPDFKRARWGVRRTFQTEQAIEKLTVFDNVATVYEHSDNGGKAGRTAAVEEALEFVGLTAQAQQTVRTMGAKERRFIEVARAVVGKPKVILLDEPAAGLPDAETALLGRIIRSIPERVGATVILVDHDMSLVQACCDWTAVLDFGRLLASGPTGEVLRDRNVMKAYLGTEEVAS